MDIIEKMHKNEYKEEKEYQLLPAMYGSCVFTPPPGHIDYQSYSYKRPSFINPKLAKQESLSSFSTKLTEQDIKNIQLVDVQMNEIYSSIPSLLEISKRNYSKFHTIMFDASKLVNKCKEKKCKITSCLNMISVLALKDLYLKYGNDEEKQRSITYGNVISVRDFTDNDAVKIKDNMGIYIMNMMNKYSSERNGSQSISSERFWNLVQSDSEFITKNIQSGNIFSTPSFEEENFTNKEAFYDLFMTNIGNLPYFYSNESLHKIESNYAGSLLNSKDFIFYQASFTFRGDLLVFVQYNSNFVQNKIVSDYISFFHSLFYKYIC